MAPKPRNTPCSCGSRKFIIKEVTYHLMRLRWQRLYAIENDIAGGLYGMLVCARCKKRCRLVRYTIGDMYV